MKAGLTGRMVKPLSDFSDSTLSIAQGDDDRHEAQAEDGLTQRLINSFVHNNRNRYADIADALNAGDIKLAHRLAHTLKSNAGQLHKTSLQNAAGDVEHMLQDGKNLATVEQMALLESELSAALAGLAPLVTERRKPSATMPLDAAATQILLEKLEPLLEMGDLDSLTLIGDLQLVPGSEELIRSMEVFDFDPALELFYRLKKELLD